MKLVIAGGGTGGHVFPGIAIAQALKKIDPNATVTFVGTKNGLEKTLVPKAGFPLEFIDVSGIKGQGRFKALGVLLSLPYCFWQCMRILRKLKPNAVIGVGGYVSGPFVLMAWLLRVPTAICEQNSVPGFTNRILGRIVKRIYGSFAYSAKFFSNKSFALVGNPLRLEFENQIESQSMPTQILVVGGSLGARALNDNVPKALGILRLKGMTVIHQTGANELEDVQESYKKVGINANVTPFIDDMVSALRHSKLVIARAGATTCAEIMAVGVPSILIPYPHAIYDHQTLNAAELVAENACVMIPQKDITPESLANKIGLLVNDLQKLENMSSNARSMHRAHAGRTIANGAINGFSWSNTTNAKETRLK